jgi:hypothetical protein
VVRVFSVVVMPAFAMLTVCCSITCSSTGPRHEQRDSHMYAAAGRTGESRFFFGDQKGRSKGQTRTA